MSAPEFHALGFGIVAFPTAALRVAAKSINDLYADLKAKEDTRQWMDRMLTLSELNKLINIDQYLQIDKRTL
jgi:2-methylisocitrate lyase-like PEP mutase family enzyme